MKKVYKKLVRDRIPEIIRAAGREYVIEILSELEYQQALRQKLVEEAHEAATADADSLIQELADLYEVIDTLMTAHHIDRSTLLEVQAERRLERGGLEQRIFLQWVEVAESDEDLPADLDDRAEEGQNKK